MYYILWSAVVVALCYGIYKSITKHHDYFRKRGIAHMKPTILFGNMVPFLFRSNTPYDLAKIMYILFPRHKIIGMFDMGKPFFCLRDPETLKQLAVKDFDHFEDHRAFVNEKVDAMFASSLLLLKGDKWRDMRATLTPAFTGSKMRQVFELVAECADQMSEAFTKKASSNGGYVDCEMKDLFTRYTNDVISSAAFGYEVNSFKDPNNDFYLAGKKFMEFNSPLAGLKVILMEVFPKVAAMLDINYTDSKVMNFFRSMVLGNIETRTKQGLSRPDMINILMNVKRGKSNDTNSAEETNAEGFATVEESAIGKNKKVKRVWTDDELVAQCFIFFLAGFNTSSTLLTFLAHELTVNADIQQKLYEEVRQTFDSLNGQRLTYDVLQKMKYMDACVSEALRHWPPVAITDRLCVKDYQYDDGLLNFKIEKGQYLFVPIYGLHHDEKYWKDPEVFDPDRFSDQNKHNINTGAYLPFGIGPRNCIGSRFALMEAKTVIFYLLLSFKFEPNADTQIPLKLKATPSGISSEKGVNVQLKLRT